MQDNFAYLLPFIMVTFGSVVLGLQVMGFRAGRYWGLGYILGAVGFALPMERLIGTRKLSQNRSPADMAGVREGLAASPDARDHTLARSIPQGVAE